MIIDYSLLEIWRGQEDCGSGGGGGEGGGGGIATPRKDFLQKFQIQAMLKWFCV